MKEHYPSCKPLHRKICKCELSFKDNICLEILKSELLTFLTGFSGPKESLKVWDI